MHNINDDIAKVLITAQEINQKVQELASLINQDYGDQLPLLICLLKGSIPFMAKLCDYLTIEIEYDCIRASSYQGTNSTLEVKINYFDLDKVKDRHVIIIEDIIDTGITLKEVSKIINQHQPKSLEIMTLLNKPSRRKVFGLEPKYQGFIIPDEFVVGFGLDFNEKYRNLPYIGILKEEIYQG